MHNFAIAGVDSVVEITTARCDNVWAQRSVLFCDQKPVDSLRLPGARFMLICLANISVTSTLAEQRFEDGIDAEARGYHVGSDARPGKWRGDVERRRAAFQTKCHPHVFHLKYETGAAKCWRKPPLAHYQQVEILLTDSLQTRFTRPSSTNTQPPTAVPPG
jgi:hypothetical protein